MAIGPDFLKLGLISVLYFVQFNIYISQLTQDNKSSNF